MGRPCFLCGLFTGYIAGTSASSQCSYGDSSSYELVDGELRRRVQKS
jgi:hypothetical protein